MESTVPLASLSLTHIQFNPADPISYLCAWLALVPQALCVVYCSLIWSTREIEIISMFLGQMASEALNFILKRIIKQERPKQMTGKGYGMPSSHAQFVSFWALAVVLFLLVRHKSPTRQETDGEPISRAQRVIAAIGASGIAGAVIVSRVYLGYHTVQQTIVGTGAGIFTAVLWFAFTEILRRQGWVAKLLQLEVIKVFRIRDLVIEEDLPAAGWEKWYARTKANKRKD